MVIPTNIVLVLHKTNKAVNSLFFIGEGDYYNNILIIILRYIRTKDIGQFLNKERPVFEKVKALVGVWFINKEFEIV